MAEHSLCLSLIAAVLASTASFAQEPAPTASGLPSEGKQDLSGGTSVPGSVNQPDANSFNAIQETQIVASDGSGLGTLDDVLVDGDGTVKAAVVAAGGLTNTRRVLPMSDLPIGTGTFKAGAKEEFEQLPEPEDADGPPWSVNALIDADIEGTDGASISDVRFAPGGIDRVVVDTGRSDAAFRYVEMPFSGLRLSGSSTAPEIALSDDGARRLSTR